MGPQAHQEGVAFSFVVEPGQGHRRLDRFLLEKLPDRTRSYLQKLIHEGHIRVDGQSAKSGLPLREGQKITMVIPEAVATPTASAETIPLDIVYEDEDLLVVNKPKGMATHPAPGSPRGTLVNALMAHCKNLSKIGGVLRPGIVHRLDKDTSGLMVVAKNDFAHNHLSKMIKRRELVRTYTALVHGIVELDEGEISAPIGRSVRDRKKMAVFLPGTTRRRWHHLKPGQHPDDKAPRSREAVTHFKVLKRFADMTLMELKLETGRTHQIRVHMTYMGHPVVGDPSYGKRPNTLGAVTQLLHSSRLEFPHPRTGKLMEFTSRPEFISLVGGKEG